MPEDGQKRWIPDGGYPVREKQEWMAFVCLVLAFGVLTASVTAVLLEKSCSRRSFEAVGAVCQEILTEDPKTEQAVMAALKKYCSSQTVDSEDGRLLAYGYEPADLSRTDRNRTYILSFCGALAGGLLFLAAVFWRNQRENARIRTLTDYVEQVNRGRGRILPGEREDAFSGLQDEICKTVTELYQTRDMAVKARDFFAENLANIAHQIRTPITAMSLTVQMMEGQPDSEHPKQIRRQLERLTHLEEALLLLSRIDAGTLPLERKKVDVFTVLMLSVDSLQELFAGAGVSADIEEAGGVYILADLDWTMEAMMNLLKNCMEHTPPGGTVRCRYEQNPLYTEIRIWDTGPGFAKEDLPHLFDRFYRGQNAKKGGIGIGLSLARGIIESQNGTIRAGNLPGGGACFEIRFYSH